MKILFIDWWTYTYDDMADGFNRLGISFDLWRYIFKDKNDDESFECELIKRLKSGIYNAVYSTNYFPVIAKCCEECKTLYISWSYDNPLNVTNIEDTLVFETNKVFLFDKVQVETFRQKGYSNVFHLPLAANCHRLNSVNLSEEDWKYYGTDIGFVGKLYPALLNEYMVGMTEYQKGYLQSICDVQQQLYGYYIVDDLLDDKLIGEINDNFFKLRGDRSVTFSKEALSYAISCQATRNERILLLALLANHFNVNLYCYEDHEILGKVNYKGTVDYISEMPKAFKASKINLNINLKISQSGVPLRVMDILGCGGFLLSSYQPEVAEYFENGKEVVLYESIDDAFDKAKWYIEHEDERTKIAMAGHKKVVQCFSYEKQISAMLDVALH